MNNFVENQLQSISKPATVANCLLLTLALFSTQAQATNGYSPIGFGTISKGMAGAGVAMPQDTISAATNPANMVLIGERADAGISWFSPSERGFTADNNGEAPYQIPPGSYSSENDYFLIPHGGWNKPLSDTSSIGISIAGNGGMNTEYDSAVFNNFGGSSSPTGVDLMQVFAGITYSTQLSDNHWLGIMPILAYQRFKAEGLEPFAGFSTAPNNVTNNGYDSSTGYGFRVGWLGQLSDRLRMGISYQSRLEMEEFKKYSGLFAEQGDFDTPSTYTIGFALQPAKEVTLLFDYQRINYGEVKALANSNTINIFADPSGLLGADGGLGFGWKDMDIIKLGAQWQHSEQWMLRMGFSHASKLFDDSQALFNILAPATIRDHLTVGATYSMDQKNDINFAVIHAFKEEVEGKNTVFTPGQTGSVEMAQWSAEVSWSWKF